MKSIKTALFGVFAAFILSACGGGGGGGNPPIVIPMVTCADGSMKTSLSLCQKTCNDGSRISEFSICQKTCADGTRVSENFEGCQQTCNNGFRIDENAVCMKTCSDFSRIPETESCEFRTAEYAQNPRLSDANVLPAYERGFFGQGVTVVLADSGVRVTHEDLADNIILEDTGISQQENRAVGEYHGTAVAGVLGAVQGNEKGSHGIAPSVKIIPFHYSQPDINEGRIGEQFHLDIWRYAPENDHPIFNASQSVGRDYVITAALANITTNSTYTSWASIISQAVGDKDTQYVWSAGNSTLNLDVVRPGTGYAYFPLIEENLRDNFLVVINLDSDHIRADHSDSCGPTRLWCIGAVAGGRHFTTGADDNSDYVGLGGTSGAAPIVSGALAILKSARPELPMTMHRQILLSTATPLGTRAINQSLDEVYGWGAVNIGAAVSAVLRVRVAQNGVLLSDLRGSLPSEMSHLRGRLSEVSVALQITDNSYYNMPLSAVLPKAESSSQAARVAAEGLMTADYAAGESFRFWGGLDYDADGGSRFLSESGGVFGAAESSDTAGYVRWASADYDGFSLFGEYEYADINADYGGDSFIQSVRGARAEGWTAGMRFADIWKFGDSLRLSATDETALSGGKMILRYPVADGDGHAAFIGGTPQTIRMKETRIPLKRQRTMIYAIGYGREYESGKWSAAAAYNEHTNATAFSIQLQTEF